MQSMKGTTIITVRRGTQVAIAGDGQVTLGNTVVKGSARKVRRMYNNTVIGGFAGSTADALTLFDKFEAKLVEHRGNLVRAAVELTKEWRTDRYLRKLEAMLLVADKEHTFILSGNGDVLEPDDGVATVGSGGAFALAAARALIGHTELSAEAIAREALLIAAEVCIYTNDHLTVEVLGE